MLDWSLELVVNLRGSWANSRVGLAQILLFVIFLTVWLLGPAYWTLLWGRDWISTPDGPWLFLGMNATYWGAFWGLWILLIKVQSSRPRNRPGPNPNPVAKPRHLPRLLPHFRKGGPEPPPGPEPHHLSRLSLYLRGQWKAVLVVVFSILLGSAMSLATPWVWGILVVDGVIGKSQLLLLPLGLGLLLATSLGSNLSSYLEGYWSEVVSQRIVYRLRVQVFEHLESLSLRFYDERRTGELISRVTNDVNVLEGSISSMTTELIPDLVMVVGAVGLLLYFDSWNTLLVATTFPPMMLVAALFKTRIRRASRNVQESVGKVASRVHETISGIRIVQSFTKEKHEADLFRGAANETLKANLESQKLSSTYSSLISLIATSGTLITVVLYAPAIVGGSKTFGQMITFLGYLTLLYGPLRGLARFHYLLERGRGAAERIFEVLDSEPEVKEAENAWELPTLRGIVEFRNVTFGYQDVPVLNDLSLRLKPGEKLALVGPSGVGKSTIVNLLLRFYDPWEGMVLVDGYDLTTVKLKSLRSQIGFVPQDCYLFNGTIKENIAYGDPDATEEEIVDAAKAANAHDFVMELPQGYDAIVGERGIKLSLGQRQRIAIARALVRKPRILIFDEATSNLDSLSEDAIKESMEKAFKGRTAFIIAHRLGTVINADKIAVIWDGGIAEVGTHRELLKKGGLYANLYRSQVSGLLKGDGDGGYPVSQ